MREAVEGKRYLRFPPSRPPLPRWRRVARNLWAGAATAPMLLAARTLGTPGLAPRGRCVALGIRALRRGDPRLAFDLIVNPMDSFRYFELQFVRDAAADLAATQRYLDVSSPRLVPLMILDERPGLIADLINPIADDLADTARLAAALGLADRARLQAVLLEDAELAAGTYDLVTCISVLEHIPDDAPAVAKMWELLRPGGRLVLTVPCARAACEEYTNIDEYGLFDGAEDGFVYWQRYYDERTLADRVWSVTGRPARTAIYGEIAPGAYDRNVLRKRTDPAYPFWREPVMMGREYRRFERLDDLPGMGVIGMQFDKPGGAG